jgi:hypothetical protein
VRGRFAAVAAAVAALAGAATVDGAAPQQFAPSLRAELGRYSASGPTFVLDVAQPLKQQPIARITLAVPKGQRLRLPSPGTTVGDAAAALVPTSGERRTPALLAGPLIAANATRAQAAGCVRTPTGSLRAALVAPPTQRLAVRKVTLRFFLHEQRGSTRLTACLPRLDALGGKSAVRRIALRISRGLDVPPNGTSVWRGFFTPVDKSGGAAAYPTTVESRGVIISPSFLTIQVQGAPAPPSGKPVSMAGALSVAGLEQGRSVRILAGRTAGSMTPIGKTRTAKLGVYRLRAELPVQKGTLLVRARVPSRRLHCGGRTADGPAGCRSATLAGVSSNVVRLRLR